MSHYCKIMTFRFLFVISAPFHAFGAYAIEESKCPRDLSSYYTNCSLNYTYMAMWCDSSNLTGVPHHESPLVDTQTPAKRAKKIYINDSCVNKLDPMILGDYWDLTVFIADNNEVATIEARTFARNTKLQRLTLSNNRIKHIHDDAFKDLKLLIRLDLKGNRILQVRKRVFGDTTNLQMLDLSNNRISWIHKEAFQNLRHLRVLNLAGNKLRMISHHVLTGLNQLRIFSTARNHLTKLDEDMFHSSVNITEVDFRENNISCIPRNLFMERTEISVVWLNENSLTTPDPGWVRRVWNKKRRGLVGGGLLGGNPWSCGCDAYRYWDFLRNEVTDREWKKLLDVECSFPSHHVGKKLSYIEKHFFKNCSVSSEVESSCSGNFATPEQSPGRKRKDAREGKVVIPTSPPPKMSSPTSSPPKATTTKGERPIEDFPAWKWGRSQREDSNKSELREVAVIGGCALASVCIISVTVVIICKYKIKVKHGKKRGDNKGGSNFNNKDDFEESRKMIRGSTNNATSETSSRSSMSISSDAGGQRVPDQADLEAAERPPADPTAMHTRPKLVYSQDVAGRQDGRLAPSAEPADVNLEAPPNGHEVSPQNTAHHSNGNNHNLPLCVRSAGNGDVIPPHEGVPMLQLRSNVAMGTNLPNFVRNNTATQW